MTLLSNLLSSSRRFELTGVPEGLDALCLGEVAQEAPGWLVHIARDEARMAALAEEIKFFAPNTQILKLVYFLIF